MRSHALDTSRSDAGLIVLDDEYGARARPWSRHPGTAHLVIADHTVSPPVPRVQAWVALLADRGFDTIRTGALAEEPAAAFTAAGFVVEQDLVLLRIDPRDRLHLVDPVRDTERPRSGRDGDALSTAADVDLAAFGATWSIDEAGVLDACTATPSHRLRLIGDQAYAVTGRAGQAGFVQRLAVRPEAQGHGLARRLMVDSLEWLRRWRVHTAMVNTHTDNVRALALYASLGFTRLDQRLVVMTRRSRPAGTR